MWDRVSPAALYLFIQHLLRDSCWPESVLGLGETALKPVVTAFYGASIVVVFFGHWNRLFAYFIMDPHKIHKVGIISLFYR